MFDKESEQKVINAISLMDKITDLYMAKHNMNFMDFLEFDNQYRLNIYILRNSEEFSNLTDDAMLEKVEKFIQQQKQLQQVKKSC